MVGRELHRDLRLPVNQIEAVVGANTDAVGVLEDALAPGIQELAVAVEDHAGVFGPREDVDLVFGVDSYAADLAPLPALRELSPAFEHFIFHLSGGCGHGILLSSIEPCCAVDTTPSLMSISGDGFDPWRGARYYYYGPKQQPGELQATGW
jgi:hypothetical protein